MSTVRNFEPLALQQAEKAQYERAVRVSKRGLFVNVTTPDDYYFGSYFSSGFRVLGLMNDRVKGKPVTVLDVGCGNGSFLRELGVQYPHTKRIGMAATQLHKKIDAEIITGDIVRRDTWESSNGELPIASSVDVAVSHLTFMHLANPLKGLENVLGLMKPDGKLFADHIRLNADPADFGPLKDALREAVDGHVKNPSH